MPDTGRTEIISGDWIEVPSTIGVEGFFQNSSHSSTILLREASSKPIELYPPSYILDPRFIGGIKPSEKLWARMNNHTSSTMTAILIHSDGGDNLVTNSVSLEIFVLDGSGNVILDASGNPITA